MWIVDTDGPFLEGKKIWLKPGKQYLFGRIEKDKKREWLIQHKTVSRKHFVLTVFEVPTSDAGQFHIRSKVVLQDTSKAGTTINGELVKCNTFELKEPVNTVRPGSNPDVLTISWMPCNVTFGLSKKQLKAGELNPWRNQLRDLDIRTSGDYVPGQTTYLVAQKRNTSKSLQALLEGRHIVNELFFSVVQMVTCPKNGNEMEVDGVSELEEDFQAKWPKPAQYLPEKGREPTEQPDETYQPNPERRKMFDKHTFFFFTQSQYDTLLPVVTTGHGKALLLQTTPNVTTIEEGYDFVKNGIGATGKAVIVQSNIEDEENLWLFDYVEELSFRCGQSSANQSDFLDAILAVDTSKLRKPVAETRSRKSQASSRNRTAELQTSSDKPTRGAEQVPTNEPTTVSQRPSPVAPQVRATSPPPTKTHEAGDAATQDDNPRPKKRTKTEPSKRALQKFDDEFDPDAIQVYDDEEEEVEPSNTPDDIDIPLPKHQSQSQHHTRRAFDEDDDMVVKQEQVRTSTQKSAATRRTQESGYEDLFHGAAAMREEMAKEEASGKPLRSALAKPKAKDPVKETRKVRLDVRQTIRAQREAEDEAERMQRQRYEEMQAEDVGKTGPSNLAIVTEVSMPVRQKPDNAYRGEQWKPEWDNRKNFKKFRRARDKVNDINAGQTASVPSAIPTVSVIIQGRGHNTPIWVRASEIEESTGQNAEARETSLEPSSQLKRRHHPVTQSRRVERAESESDDDEHVSSETRLLQEEASSVLDHPVDIRAPRRTRGAGSETQTQTSASRSTAGGDGSSKRFGSTAFPSRSAAHKRQRLFNFDDEPQSSASTIQEDPLKFKFIKRNRNKA